MIHQHFMLVNTLTVAENVALGIRPSRTLTDLDAVSARIEELSGRYGLKVDPQAVVWQLSVGERQRVEIIKALYRDVSLLILDEPTAVLTPQEVDDLFAVLRQMVADGRGLVFISHKIREVLALSDRITVLRNGRKVGTVLPAEVTSHSLAEMMVGHELPAQEPPAAGGHGEVRLAVRDLHVKGDRGVDAVRGLGLEVRSGEIVGIAGVSGNGQRELAEAIAGLRTPAGGSISLDGTRARRDEAGSGARGGARLRPRGADARRRRRRLQRRREPPPDRQRLAAVLAVRVPPRRRRPPPLGRARRRVRRQDADLDTPARNLSGGNIQKLILARELSARPRVLLAAQPTRGVDVGAARYIHERLMRQRDGGTAILVVSEDLDEVLSLSDRVLVMYEGEIIAEANPRESTREALGLMMAGVRAEAASG